MKTFAQKHWPEEDKLAVAYELNFVSMVYSYDASLNSDFYKPCHENCKIESVHYADFECPKRNIKKDYFQLDWYCYGVSTVLKKKIIEFGIDDDPEKVFRPIWTKKHDTPIGWSIDPCHFYQILY